jgi:hypothetical protein
VTIAIAPTNQSNKFLHIVGRYQETGTRRDDKQRMQESSMTYWPVIRSHPAIKNDSSAILSASRVSRIVFARGSSARRHTPELNLRRCILSVFRVLCCAVQGNHHATFVLTELRGLLAEPRFDRTAGKISKLAKTADHVSVRSDLNDAVPLSLACVEQKRQNPAREVLGNHR